MVSALEWISVEAAAEALHVHPDYIRKMLRTRSFPSDYVSKIGNRWRIRQDVLADLFLEDTEKTVASRPEINEESIRESLRRQGCPENFVSPLLSDIKLIIPLLLRNRGEEAIFRDVIGSVEELGLGKQDEFWRLALKYLVGWATEEIDKYKRGKGVLV